MTRLAAAAVLALSFSAFAASDPDDAEGAKDHPDIKRWPGFYIGDGRQADFGEHTFWLGEDKKTGESLEASHEGRYWYLSYYKKEGTKTPSPLEVIRNYENAFKARGGALVAKQNTVHGGHATYRMPLGKSERWVQLEVANSGEMLTFTIIELAGMEQKVEVTASEMLDAINRDGFIALHGIEFDTGKDTLRPDSGPLLGEIVSLLKGNAELKLAVEGHTDNVGNAKANEALSRKRADSVKKFLVAQGIAAARLSTNGFGDKKPVADNRTEAGRAKNRRVELVKK
jgi:OOP family OmpA-OmpF porin